MLKSCLLIVLSLLLASCAGFRTKIDYDPGTDFKQFQSYYFNNAAKKADSLTVSRVKKALQAKLSSLGMQRVEEAGDLKVAITLRVDKKVDVDHFFAIPIQRRFWGAGVAIETREYDVDTLVIDFIDAQSNRVIRQGLASGNIQRNEDPMKQQARIDKIVTEIFAKFPK